MTYHLARRFAAKRPPFFIRLGAVLTLCTVSFSFNSTAQAQLRGAPQPDRLIATAPAKTFDTEEAKWAAFSNQVRQALTSKHAGLEQGALRQIIRYGTQLDLGRKEAVEVMRICRESDNDDVRRMAVVAIGSMDDAWALGQLASAMEFEEIDRVRKTMQAVVATGNGIVPDVLPASTETIARHDDE